MKRIVAIIGIVFCLSAALFFLLKDKADGPTQHISVAKAWWPGWDTFQLGVGRYEQDHTAFKTTFKQSEDYGAALKDFQLGKVNAATLTIYEAILAKSSGIPLKILLLLDYTIGSDGIVAAKGIDRLSGIKGKIIGVEKGTIAHFTVLKGLEKAGISAKEVIIKNYANSDLLQQAFSNGEISVVGTYEPYMSIMVNENDGHVVFSSKEIPRAICDVLFVNADVIKKYPGVAQHWVNAWQSILHDKDLQPETYLKDITRINGTPVEDFKASLDGIHFTGIPENRRAFGTAQRPGYLLESLIEMETFMIEQGVLKHKLPLAELIDFEVTSGLLAN